MVEETQMLCEKKKRVAELLPKTQKELQESLNLFDE